jgi:hypothetical protein
VFVVSLIASALTLLVGAVLGAWLARRNEKHATADRLLLDTLSAVVDAIAAVATGAGDSAQQRYASAMSRLALHASPEVVAAFRRFGDDATTATADGRERFLAAVQAARRARRPAGRPRRPRRLAVGIGAATRPLAVPTHRPGSIDPGRVDTRGPPMPYGRRPGECEGGARSAAGMTAWYAAHKHRKSRAMSSASSTVSRWVATLGRSGTETLKPPSASGTSTTSYSRRSIPISLRQPLGRSTTSGWAVLPRPHDLASNAGIAPERRAFRPHSPAHAPRLFTRERSVVRNHRPWPGSPAAAGLCVFGAEAGGLVIRGELALALKQPAHAISGSCLGCPPAGARPRRGRDSFT